MDSDSLFQLSLYQFNSISHPCMVKVNPKVTSTLKMLPLLVTDCCLHNAVNSTGSS